MSNQQKNHGRTSRQQKMGEWHQGASLTEWIERVTSAMGAVTRHLSPEMAMTSTHWSFQFIAYNGFFVGSISFAHWTKKLKLWGPLWCNFFHKAWHTVVAQTDWLAMSGVLPNLWASSWNYKPSVDLLCGCKGSMVRCISENWPAGSNPTAWCLYLL
jgi:hypothetical protein